MRSGCRLEPRFQPPEVFLRQPVAIFQPLLPLDLLELKVLRIPRGCRQRPERTQPWKIGISSEAGIVLNPYADEQNEFGSAGEENPQEELERPMNALVVESNLKSQCLLAKVLAERGHEVTTFENAEQAILAYQKAFYPLLFVEVNLPGMNGLQYCRWIRNQARGSETYIIAAIEPTLPNEAKQVLEAGANDFLIKPYQLDPLRARLVIGERQMARLFEQQRLELNLQSETQRWSQVEAAMARSQKEFEATLKAKEAELDQLRLTFNASSSQSASSFESKLTQRDSDLQHRQEEIGELWERCGGLECALDQSRQDCERAQLRARETEHELESAMLDLGKLRNGDTSAADLLRQQLSSREQEVCELRQELASLREEQVRRLRGHAEELVRLGDQLRENLEDRNRMENELKAARAELSRRGREQADDTLRLADELRALVIERHKLEAELRRQNQQRDCKQEISEELQLHRAARKQFETRWRVLMRLGSELNQSSTAEGVARVAGRATQELLGWDLFSLDQYCLESDQVHSVLCLEMDQGHDQDCRPLHPEGKPTGLMRRVLEDGPQLVLRPASTAPEFQATVVGHRVRHSASVLCVPIVIAHQTCGFISVRSGVENAYRGADLESLQMLAAQCAGALERIELRPEEERSVVQVQAEAAPVGAGGNA